MAKPGTMRLWSAVAAVALVVLPGCSTKGFVFRTDTSIDIVAPIERARVTLPVTLRWDDARLGTAGADERYGVFIDRTPMRPGRPVVSVVDDLDADEKRTCRTTPGCPSADVLLDRGVIVTTEREVTLEFLSDLRPNGTGDDPHEVTIVRLRGDERVGEAAFRTTFFVRR
jgi:hypothetical protein